MRRERDKLNKSLGGIREMSRTPSAVWIVDTNKEHLAVEEARKLHIPIIGILDSTATPTWSTSIPGNDGYPGCRSATRSPTPSPGLIARSGVKTGQAPGSGRRRRAAGRVGRSCPAATPSRLRLPPPAMLPRPRPRRPPGLAAGGRHWPRGRRRGRRGPRDRGARRRRSGRGGAAVGLRHRRARRRGVGRPRPPLPAESRRRPRSHQRDRRACRASSGPTRQPRRRLGPRARDQGQQNSMKSTPRAAGTPHQRRSLVPPAEAAEAAASRTPSRPSRLTARRRRLSRTRLRTHPPYGAPVTRAARRSELREAVAPWRTLRQDVKKPGHDRRRDDGCQGGPRRGRRQPDSAIDILRTKGAGAAKRGADARRPARRPAGGALVQINCETDTCQERRLRRRRHASPTRRSATAGDAGPQGRGARRQDHR